MRIIQPYTLKPYTAYKRGGRIVEWVASNIKHISWNCGLAVRQVVASWL